MLAGELRLGGADVIVLEQKTEPTTESRGLGFTARAAEVFAQRGILARFGDIETSSQGHFGGIPMDFGASEGSYFGVRGIPQSRTEGILEDWALDLGAEIVRGNSLVGLRQDSHGVTAEVDGPAGRRDFTGSYLVGCDGGRSATRRLGGFDFEGTAASREMYLADVVGRNIEPRFIGERVAGGMVMSAPLEPGVDRIIVCERAPYVERREALTFDDVADGWQRLTGQSLHGAETRWVSAFTDATRQVTQYRRGRVLLAGDAAHTHLPAGGQGLSLGIQDAANLGWKLASVVRGSVNEELLDTYHDERHPIGAGVLRNTRAQGLLYLSGVEVEPLRAVVSELMTIPEVRKRLSGMVSGLDIRYGSDHSDELEGLRMPNLAVGATTVFSALHLGKGLFITASGSSHPSVEGWDDRVDSYVVDARELHSTKSVLVRPDGYVAWAGGPGLFEALHQWFGVPAVEARASLSSEYLGDN